MSISGQGGAAPAALPSAKALASGWRLEVHAELPSTSALLAARAEAGEAEGLAVQALQQTAGRGRAGRAWSSPPGNLYLSVLLRPAGPAREAPQWSLLAGVALAEAAAEVVRDPASLRLKWPNDLLLSGAKCAGILAESALTPAGGIAWLTLGIGVNLAHAPALPERRTATLDGAGTPQEFAASLLARIAAWREVQRARGFAPIRAAWLRFGPAVGERIMLRSLPDGGHFAGLAEDGSLLLDMDGTRRAIPAGEILSEGEA